MKYHLCIFGVIAMFVSMGCCWNYFAKKRKKNGESDKLLDASNHNIIENPEGDKCTLIESTESSTGCITRWICCVCIRTFNTGVQVDHNRNRHESTDKEEIIGHSTTSQLNRSVRSGYKPPSLVNVGATCYLNSAFQGISACDTFVLEIADLCRRFNAGGVKQLFVFKELIDILNGCSNSRMEISRNPIFRHWNRRGQQDSYELLAYAMNEVYNELRAYKEEIGDIPRRDLKRWLGEKLPMRFILQYNITCGCGTKTISPLQSDLAFHVTIPSNESVCVLDNLIDLYFRNDPIEDYVCDKKDCNGKNAMRLARLCKPLPRTICIHLQRTFWNGRRMVKINKEVKFSKLITINSAYFTNENDVTSAEEFVDGRSSNADARSEENKGSATLEARGQDPEHQDNTRTSYEDKNIEEVPEPLCPGSIKEGVSLPLEPSEETKNILRFVELDNQGCKEELKEMNIETGDAFESGGSTKPMCNGEDKYGDSVWSSESTDEGAHNKDECENIKESITDQQSSEGNPKGTFQEEPDDKSHHGNIEDESWSTGLVNRGYEDSGEPVVKEGETNEILDTKDPADSLDIYPTLMVYENVEKEELQSHNSDNGLAIYPILMAHGDSGIQDSTNELDIYPTLMAYENVEEENKTSTEVPENKIHETAQESENDDVDRIYNLVSVIVHSGSVGSGHYVCYKRVDDKWFLTNDSSIREVSEQDVFRCQAYILFYEVPYHQN